MGIINLESIQPGMVLASDVKDLSGRVLLTTGSELTEKHLRVFKIWGVSEADIQGVDQKDVVGQVVSQEDPMLTKNAEEKTANLFALTKKDHPAIAELMRLTVSRFLRDAQKGVA